jgi:hypothetical protein
VLLLQRFAAAAFAQQTKISGQCSFFPAFNAPSICSEKIFTVSVATLHINTMIKYKVKPHNNNNYVTLTILHSASRVTIGVSISPFSKYDRYMIIAKIS